VKAAGQAGAKVSFDGNYRSKLWEARGESGQAILKSLIEHATLAFIDERDISLLLGREIKDRKAAAEAAFAAFPKLQMTAATSRETHGVDDYSLGATVFTPGGSFAVEPIALPGVIDRIGGGDAFAAGFLFGITKALDPAEALSFALYSAGAKHGQVGDANHASEAEIRALMTGGKLDVKR
jgi:2-dehydro-3-deoxygluconokinase